MNERLQKAVIGGLLHDVGKVLFRASDGRNHSISGYDFLKEEIRLKDNEILDQVRYHHKVSLRSANIPDDSLAYITYMADNISAASDRRKKDDGNAGFDKMLPLDSIFNLLNHNSGHAHYQPATLDRKEGIHYPTEDETPYTEAFYQRVRDNLKEVLSNLEYTDQYLNSILEVLEADLSYVPSSTSKEEISDISLFDHVKLTAAIGSCIFHYLEDSQVNDYKKSLFENERDFYSKPVFLLFSMDMSGIQSFIYGQYGNEDVLKNLRSRSFYLELMLENMIDDLLQGLELSRANRIYSGGGHAYLLLPNTEKTKRVIDGFEQRVNDWLLQIFKTDLYLACGYAECSSEELRNIPEGSYAEVFKKVSSILSDKKLHRYSVAQIRILNNGTPDSHDRECRICHRSDHLTEENLCIICDGLIHLSKGILIKEFFTIMNSPVHEHSMPVGDSRYMVCDSKEELLSHIKDSDNYIRSYCKNTMYTGQDLATKLWVGDYSSDSTLGKLVEKGTGIKRLGVLRADIDNLGQAFVAGFPEEHASLSRSSTFSRKLSLFFKLHINDILENGDYSLDGQSRSRNASIVYSGGDDIFIVGAWKDILEFAVDLRRSFRRFSQNTLTLSAGYGIFPEKYPISYIAEQTGDLEDLSKELDGKDGITLFDKDNSYKWDMFIDKVLGEKFQLIYEFFTVSTQRGKNFLYNLLDLMRNRGEKINLARFAYVLARLEPDEKASDLEKEVYKKFSRTMYSWMIDDEECRQAITAIYLYAYLIGSEEGELN